MIFISIMSILIVGFFPKLCFPKFFLKILFPFCNVLGFTVKAGLKFSPVQKG